MTIADMIRIGLILSIVLIVLGQALAARPSHAFSLFTQPGLLVRTVVAMSVVMPLVAIGFGLINVVVHPVAVVLLALALSPVPPVLPNKIMAAKGSKSFAIGILVATAVLAIFLMPLGIAIIGWAFGHDIWIPLATVARIVFMTVLGPMIIGLVVAWVWPSFAKTAAPWVSKVGLLLLLVCLVPVLVRQWPAIVGFIGDGTVLVMAAFALIALVVGHLLGGPGENDRTVLALCTSTRHPGVAFAVTTAALPDLPDVAPAILLYVLVVTIVTIPHVIWRRRRASGNDAETAPSPGP